MFVFPLGTFILCTAIIENALCVRPVFHGEHGLDSITLYILPYFLFLCPSVFRCICPSIHPFFCFPVQCFCLPVFYYFFFLSFSLPEYLSFCYYFVLSSVFIVFFFVLSFYLSIFFLFFFLMSFCFFSLIISGCFFFYGQLSLLLQSDGNSFGGDVVSDSFNNLWMNTAF